MRPPREGPSKGSGAAKRPVKRPVRVDAAWVEARVGAYLSTRTCPRGHLRRLIVQKIDRALADAEDRSGRESLLTALDEVLDRAERAGLIDDAAWAASRTRRLVERGVSPGVIGGRLASKGVKADVREQAMVDTEAEVGDPMQVAALAYAQRRHLGPWRTRPGPGGAAALAAQYTSDLGKMARAGFPYAVARDVLRSDPGDDGAP